MRSNINIRPMTPVHGTFEPGPDTPVHYITPAMRVICGVRGPAHRVKSRLLGNVTCPACLQLLNLPAPSQRPPCGSPDGSTTLSAESAQTAREKTDNSEVTGLSAAGRPNERRVR